MKDLRWFLISRLVIVVIPVVVAEQLMIIVLRNLIFPQISTILNSGIEVDKAAGFVDLLLVMRSILFGNGAEAATFGILRGSIGCILFLLIVVLWLLPIVYGIVFYAVLVEKKVKVIEAARDEEHRQYDRKRSLMLSDFAHDLRTPIMTVGGYAHALKDGMVTDEEMQHEYLEAIVRKSDRLKELINMLFEYAKLDSSGFTLTRKKIDVHELLLNVTASFYMDLEEAGMTTVIEVEEEPFRIFADGTELTRIFENLLKNAMIHNPSGTEIYIGNKKIPGGEDLIIADTGGLIRKSEEELFSPFVRGDDSRSGDKGSGLGLSVAKKIADMHGYPFSFKQPYDKYTKAFVLRVFSCPENCPEPYPMGKRPG